MGAGILSGADSRSAQDRGEMVIIIGLAIQLISFGFFIIVAAVFHWRLNKSPMEASLLSSQLLQEPAHSARHGHGEWILLVLSMLIEIA
ncbi:hypothetical protein BKA81DRAFT_343677 [Phyllosticta paracitricarpa]